MENILGMCNYTEHGRPGGCLFQEDTGILQPVRETRPLWPAGQQLGGCPSCMVPLPYPASHPVLSATSVGICKALSE